MAQIDDHFPTVSIVGGPHGAKVAMRMNGELMKGVTRFELTGDVKDILRLKTFQIVKAVVSVDAEHEHSVTVRVVLPVEEERDGVMVVVGDDEIATSTADTLWQALEDVAKQVRLKANS